FKHLDIILGDIEPLATGYKNPDYQARTHPFTGVLRYTEAASRGVGELSAYTDRDRQILDDGHITPELRAVVGEVLQRIPRAGGEVHDMRWPGRYEIAVVRHEIPIIVDDEVVVVSELAALCLDAQPDLGGFHPYAVPEEPLYYNYGERAN